MAALEPDRAKQLVKEGGKAFALPAGAMTKSFNTGANSDAAIGSGAAAKGSVGNSTGGVGGRGVVIVEW